MSYDDDLGAPVWDDGNESSNLDSHNELAKTFASLHAIDQEDQVKTDEEVDSEYQQEPWSNESGERKTPVAEKKDLMMSLAPQEDPLAGIAAPDATQPEEIGESLFGGAIKSPLEVVENDAEKSSLSSQPSVVSPSRKSHARPKKLFSSVRQRRRPLTEAQKADMFEDPLASNATNDKNDDEFVEESLDYESAPGKDKVDLLQQMDGPLFRISPRKSLSSTPSVKRVMGEEPVIGTRPEAAPVLDKFEPPSNKYTIEVVDPLKIGDLTFAHVEYTIWTRSENLNPSEVRVQRRYRDFRWLYRQLQNNHWGKIIPPPPEKQAVGRFRDDFVEGRRFQMERMLVKIAQDRELQDDEDFIMFLQSQNFSQDSKVRENLTGSNASSDSNDISEIHISLIELLGSEDASSVMRNGGLDESQKGFMNISFASLPKYVESDAYFVEQRHAVETLEEQLKQLCKSLEIVDTQTNDLASVMEEFSNTIKSLEELEVSKKGSETLNNFAEVHMRIKESLQRSTMQESLTLGVTIDEYMRSLASVRAIFNQRSKLGYFSVVLENDLLKKRAQLDRNSHKGPSDKVDALTKDLQVLQERHSKIKKQLQEVGDRIRRELRKHEHEKIVDFRNSIEIFLESSIETQKECIELWETFYQNNL
ncbi:LADA_0A01442g1_1 [Lachancea dasiensis]|uniref:LADA_0A01442g1_1 n=1 Tax=Lachancea dasiensis TaxID=1072105 RepID=A0A1G4IM39_9SACH|nr:LADA_0A01442g1_1 [Lachancea dasiensis]